MKIAGFQKLTLLDYPGKLAAMIFTPGCMWRCHYCHNPELVLACALAKMEMIPEEDVFEHLNRRQGKLDGLVITGGEPTLQLDLIDFVRKVKDLGFLVKLDTNGVAPSILEQLFKEKLLDYVAMDVKASEEKYDEVTGRVAFFEKIKESMELIQKSGVEYEFRTTVLPRFHDECELKKIAMMIGEGRWYLQRFRPGVTLDPTFGDENTYQKEEIYHFAQLLEDKALKIGVRV